MLWDCRSSWTDSDSMLATEFGVAEHFAGSDHGGFFRQLDLVLLVHHARPHADLLVDVDLYRTHIRAN